ncbi:hypothetical protein C2845_PM09G05700 [Panicum miliaceum]|uniref:CN hydrolase domain-containing protein n=1 Tax=Panicum miliaceum TaxID=4540 RepID=A0A3L6S2V5_PANMI|nr:hypothetical protein C2845_PM09G05700 [Panicum miliaceum]
MAQTSVSQKYKVALCQLLVSPDKEENIACARARIEAAADAGAMLIEIWSCPYSLETLPSYAEDIDGGASPSISMLSEVAAARKITIVGGSIPEKASGKVFNTCCVIGPDGQILAKHRKFGEVLAAAGHEEVTVIGEIDLSMIQSTRHGKENIKARGEPPVGDAEQRRPVPIGGCAEAESLQATAPGEWPAKTFWSMTPCSELCCKIPLPSHRRNTDMYDR